MLFDLTAVIKAETGMLANPGHFSAYKRQINAVVLGLNFLPLKGNTALCHCQPPKREAQQHLEQGGLATATLAHNRKGLPLCKREGDPIENDFIC